MGTTEQAFSELMAIAGRLQPSFVELHEQPRALLTRLAVGEGAAAALAAGATLAADLHEMRGGGSQRVVVSTREASASLISFSYQKFGDSALAPDLFRSIHPVSGFFPTRDDRYVYLHPSFPGSTRRLMQLLDCPEERDAISGTVKQRDALALESAIAKAGACGAMVRSAAEWDASDQGRILASRPVVEVVKVADSDPVPLPPGHLRPLSGIRVLDLTRVLAGPTCARTLAQYGAEVMRIGSPDLPSVPAFVADTGHGKLSAHLDLNRPADVAKLHHLIETTDIFSQGYRTGALERRGFGLLDLVRRRPGIIYVSINCYGHEGAWRTRPGWEQLAQTVTGIADLQGGEKGPSLLPCAATDYTTGYLAAFGALIALRRRAETGGSYLVRVSLSQTGVWLRRLGIAEPASLAAMLPLSDDEIASFSVHSETGFGPMTHLRPAVQLSQTPTAWQRGVVPLGTHAPVWPALLSGGNAIPAAGLPH